MGVSGSFRVVSWALLGVALVVPAVAQEARTMLAMPPTPLLPEALRTGPDHDAGNGAPAWSGADAPILVEDGIKRYERGNAPAPARGSVTVYQFDDATGAYAAYTYLRRSAGGKVTQSGVSVVISSLKPEPAALMKTVEIGLPKIGGTKGLAPLLPTYLPQKGLEKDSVRYALGPAGYQSMGGGLPVGVVGFDKAAEVVTAKYQGRGTLTLLLYPTPQIAGDHGRQIAAEMNREGSAAGTVKLRREGTLVAMTTGSWNAAEAKALVESIHLRDQLTWNKPMPLEFHAEVKKTYNLLTSIAIFCGVGALAAIILGLFLGGGRAAIRVMQGKPAATEPEFLRIDLSGRSEPIHAEGTGGAEPKG